MNFQVKSVGFIAGGWEGVGECCPEACPDHLWKFQAPSGHSLERRESRVGRQGGGGEREQGDQEEGVTGSIGESIHWTQTPGCSAVIGKQGVRFRCLYLFSLYDSF